MPAASRYRFAPRSPVAPLALAAVVCIAAAVSSAAAGAQRQQADSLPATLIARGDSIFSGRLSGGNCFACHLATGKGVPSLGPDLTDSLWLNGDGSLNSIIETVTRGVAKPKVALAPMLPMAGLQLTPEDVKAVSAYVYSLSNPKRQQP